MNKKIHKKITKLEKFLHIDQFVKKTDLKKMFIQIVGHTLQSSIDIKGKTTGGKYYYIDTLPNNEYLVEIDGELIVDSLLLHHFSMCRAIDQNSIFDTCTKEDSKKHLQFFQNDLYLEFF